MNEKPSHFEPYQPSDSARERDGRKTGIESDVSAQAAEAKIAEAESDKRDTQRIGQIRRLFVGLHQQDDQVVPKDAVLEIIATRYPTFTVTESTGYYNGTPEPTLVIEIAAPGGPNIEGVARDLADAFDQDAIGIETGGVYTRVFGERKRRTAQLALRDRTQLSAFAAALRPGKTFRELEPETQAWWLNRY